MEIHGHEIRGFEIRPDKVQAIFGVELHAIPLERFISASHLKWACYVDR